MYRVCLICISLCSDRDGLIRVVSLKRDRSVLLEILMTDV